MSTSAADEPEAPEAPESKSNALVYIAILIALLVWAGIVYELARLVF